MVGKHLLLILTGSAVGLFAAHHRLNSTKSTSCKRLELDPALESVFNEEMQKERIKLEEKRLEAQSLLKKIREHLDRLGPETARSDRPAPTPDALLKGVQIAYGSPAQQRAFFEELEISNLKNSLASRCAGLQGLSK